MHECAWQNVAGGEEDVAEDDVTSVANLVISPQHARETDWERWHLRQPPLRISSEWCVAGNENVCEWGKL